MLSNIVNQILKKKGAFSVSSLVCLSKMWIVRCWINSMLHYCFEWLFHLVFKIWISALSSKIIREDILSVAIFSSLITAKTYSHIHNLNNGCRIMHSQEHHPISRGSENSIYCCILILKFSVRVFLNGISLYTSTFSFCYLYKLLIFYI